VRGVHPEVQWLDKESKEISPPIVVMHICYPYSDRFVEDTVAYIERFQPALVLIESTVKPGTTDAIWERVKTSVRTHIVHSPERGRKADGWKWCLFTYTKFIGGVTPQAAVTASCYYSGLGFKTHVCRGPKETEFAKLIDVTYYGLGIAWFQELQRICEKHRVSLLDIEKFIHTTTIESGGKHAKPIYTGGFIGGHCVIPAAKMLNGVYPSKFIEALLDSNERREKEADYLVEAR